MRLFSTLVAAFVVAPAALAQAKYEYNRDIRPILAENCFACHGPDSAARKAELRLDRREDAIAPAPSCPASRVKALWWNGSTWKTLSSGCHRRKATRS